jgi:hypothetical protein
MKENSQEEAVLTVKSQAVPRVTLIPLSLRETEDEKLRLGTMK